MIPYRCMVDSFGNLVVRSHAPRRRAVLVGLAVLLAVAILYTAFELGRYDAGFRVVDSVRGALSASSRIRSLERENEKQRTQLAAAEVARRVSLAYSFRYFQDYDEPVQLPQGFEPTRVEVEIHSSRDRDVSHSFRQAFVWKAQGMSVETEASGNPAKGEADVQTE